MLARILSVSLILVVATSFFGAAATHPAQAKTLTSGSGITVTLSPTRLTFAPSTAPTGAVVFTIENKTRLSRTFTIDGSKSPRIGAGQSVTLRVVFKTDGFYSSASAGRASHLAGLFHIVDPCTNPSNTTVNVQMAQDQGAITLSQTSIPCGTVTFVVTNTGNLIDSLQVFADIAESAGTTPELNPGQTARFTVHFTVKGIAYYQSGDYPPAEPEFGGDYGEGGQITIN